MMKGCSQGAGDQPKESTMPGCPFPEHSRQECGEQRCINKGKNQLEKIHDIIEKGSLVLLESLKGEAGALAKATMSYREILATNHGIAAKTSRVLMDRDVYPKTWKETAKK